MIIIKNSRSGAALGAHTINIASSLFHLKLIILSQITCQCRHIIRSLSSVLRNGDVLKCKKKEKEIIKTNTAAAHQSRLCEERALNRQHLLLIKKKEREKTKEVVGICISHLRFAIFQ